MILDEFNNRLSELGLPVFYGTQLIGKDEPWNYVVFNRRALTVNESRNSVTTRIDVAVVQEGYVEEGMHARIAELLCSIPGVRLGSGDAAFDYTVKPGTGIVVEVMVAEFLYAEKR